MESVGPVVLIVVTVAVGLALIAAVVQLWRHQPVHHDTADAGDDAGSEETVQLTGSAQVTDDPGEDDPGEDDPEEDDPGDQDAEETVALDRGEDDEETVDLRSSRP